MTRLTENASIANAKLEEDLGNEKNVLSGESRWLFNWNMLAFRWDPCFLV